MLYKINQKNITIKTIITPKYKLINEINLDNL